MRHRHFRADYVRRDGKVGIGIVEYVPLKISINWENYVVAIHSIYDDNNTSNRGTVSNIFQYIRNRLLDDDEKAIVQLCRYNKSQGIHIAYNSKIIVRGMSRRLGHAYHAELLAEDALRRQSTIKEEFDDYMQFSIVQQEKEERSNGN